MSPNANPEYGMRGFVISTWVLYAFTFVPFKLPKEYLVQWLFVVVAIFGVLGVCVLAFRNSKRWKLASLIAATTLLMIYIGYWASITVTARETNPGLMTPIAFGHIFEQGFLIAAHLWGRSARVGAAQVAYFEMVMPLVQGFILLWIGTKQRISRGI
jgi:hypothetical protein